MRLKVAILAAVMVIATACSGGAAPAPAASTQADIDLTGPVALTLWHTQTGANAKALQDLVDKYNSTNDKKIPVTPQYPGSSPQLYHKNPSPLHTPAHPHLTL